MQTNQEYPTLEEVWKLFKETDKKFQDTDKKFQDTDKKFRDTDKEFDKTKIIVEEMSQKINEFGEFVKENIKENKKRTNELEHLFNMHWSKLIESLVAGDLINLLNQQGIAVNYISQRVRIYKFDRQYEFDIIAEDGDIVVIVEVKTTLRPNDVKEFTNELKDIKLIFPKYNNNIVIGAVAFLTAYGESDVMAQKKGLFTIKATGKSAHITNPADFKPKEY